MLEEADWTPASGDERKRWEKSSKPLPNFFVCFIGTRVWTVPPVYSRLGLIYGYTIIWAKLNRKGEMLDYKVLKHEGHTSLLESSVGAIRSSFPFKPLPDNFPDEFLEITFLLRYPNLREPSQ